MALVVKSNTTARIQEAHSLAGHLICQLVDYLLFQTGSKKISQGIDHLTLAI